MAKILLVEDDKSLREIYGVRLMAEGYEIVSAGDGEEALAMAIKERPDLIVSDVMMPKISGFDMLDILRSTTETKNVKVIMMTALSSDDQRARGEALGADRYLVKSQVGIEDVVRTVHDVLGDSIAPATPAAQPTYAPTPAAVAMPVPTAPPTVAPVSPTQYAEAPVYTQPAPAPTPAPMSQPEPVAIPTPVAPEPPVATMPAPQPIMPSLDPMLTPSPAPAPAAYPPRPATPVQPRPMNDPTMQPMAAPAPAPYAEAPVYAQPAPAPAPMPQPNPVMAVPPAPVAMPTPTPLPVQPPMGTPTTAMPTPNTLPQPTAPFSSPAPASLGERVIEPLTNMNPAGTVDIASQLAQELNTPAGPSPTAPPNNSTF